MGAFDGNGNFLRSYNWVSDKTNGIPITSSRMDTEDNGFAGGLTLAVTRDGQGKMAAHFQPSADATWDLGQNALRWRNLFCSGNATVGGSLTVTGAMSGFNVPQIFQKTSSQTVTNSTSTVIDTQLQSGTLGQGTYQFEALLIAGNAGPGGLRVAPNVSNAITHGQWVEHGMSNSATNTVGQQGVTVGGTPTGIVVSSSQGAQDWYRLEGYFSKSSNSDVFAIYWAQGSANATGTTLAAGSYLKLTQINTSFF